MIITHNRQHYIVPDEVAEKIRKYDEIVKVLAERSPYNGNRETCDMIRAIVTETKMDNDELYHVEVIEHYRDLSWIIPDFIERLGSEVTRVIKKCPAELHFADGTKVIFIPQADFAQWCKGRTYWMDGKKYRSGHLLEQHT